MVSMGRPVEKRIYRRTSMSTNSDTTQASWELPEAVWQRMEPLIPARKSKEGRPRTVDLKRITEGIFFVLRTGIQWQAGPRGHFWPPRTVYYYFAPWVKAGVFGQFW